MKKLLIILAVLLISALFAATAFAQDADVMQLSPFYSNAGTLINTQRVDCLSHLDFDNLPVSESLLFSSFSLIYGFEDAAGGGGLNDGSVTNFCWLHTFSEPCGSCTLSWGGEGENYWTEFWCIGRMIWRSDIQCLWCP